ncbi:MAG: sodium/proline symporter [Clostridiales bacterium]|nr:sodium/proline symporter [Clostridiales bacterium]
MTTSQIFIMLAIVCYLVVMLAIGISCSKQNNSVEDFYLGGRKIGPIVTAMSAESADMSSWLLMGLPGVAYLSGVADASWTAIGLAIGTYVNWLIVAKRIRIYSHCSNNATTIPDFFENRYRDQSHLLMGISAILIIVFFVPYTASGFAACGKLFTSLFDMDYMVAMIISAIVIVGYTAIGGFFAASMTDMVQSAVMSIALIVVLGYGVTVAGGVGAVIENAKDLPGYFSFVETYQTATQSAGTYGWLSIITTLSWGLGYFGMPHILLRFMAIEDQNKLKLSRRIASIWVVISLAVAIFIGLIGNAMTNVGAVPVLAGSASETLIVKIASLISEHGILASIVAGVIMAGILSATMSTADSQLLASSSSVSQNLIRGVFGLKISDKSSMLIARITVIVVSVIAAIIASNPDSSVFGIVSFAWAGFGASFGPVVLFSLFWKRSNRNGAVAGMITGGVMVFVWKYLVRPMGGMWDIYELLPAFLLASAMIVIVSYLSAPPSEEIVAEFEKVRNLNQQ